MVKLNLVFLKITVFFIFSLVFVVSDTQLYIKLIFISSMLFFLLPMNGLFTKERFLRKVHSAFSGAVIFTVLFILITPVLVGGLSNFPNFSEFGASFLLVLFFALLGFFIYGIPVSLLSDRIAARFSNRLLMAGVIHLAFGLALLMTDLFLVPVICALIFWMIDERLLKMRMTI